MRRITHAMFDISLPIIDVAARIADELREDSDAKALNACVKKIEQLGNEGWRHAETKNAGVSLRCVDLDVQLQPDRVLANDAGSHLFLYSYYRQSPPLSTDAIRALLCLVRLATAKQNFLRESRIVVLDCYKDSSYEGSDFNEAEPWTAKQIDKVLGIFNAMYRIHLDGSPPPQMNTLGKPRRPRALRADGAAFSAAPRNQLCLQFSMS